MDEIYEKKTGLATAVTATLKNKDMLAGLNMGLGRLGDKVISKSKNTISEKANKSHEPETGIHLLSKSNHIIAPDCMDGVPPSLDQCVNSHKKVDPDFYKPEDPVKMDHEIKEAWRANPNGKCPHMGIPAQLANSKVVFPRCFRFRVISKLFENLDWLTTKIEVDLVNKHFILWAMDMDWTTAEYVDKLASGQYDELSVPYYDGCGNVIFTVTYYNCKIAGHNFGCNYSDSNVIAHKIHFNFDLAKKSIPNKGENTNEK